MKHKSLWSIDNFEQFSLDETSKIRINEDAT